MPNVCPWYSPEPKSGCNGVLLPMKLMMAEEFGSTGALEMLVFQRLLGGKGTKPFKLPSGPWVITLQGLFWAETVIATRRLLKSNRRLRDLTCMAILRS